MPTLEHIAERLATHPPEVSEPETGARQASVAIILRARASRRRPGERVTDVLFIRRAEKDGDPWSGHMAFPGGHRDQSDASLLAAALRETREEIGLDLEREARRLGRLSEVRTHLRDGALPRSVVPFAFALAGGEPALSLNHEVAEVVWVPLAFLADPANRESMDYAYRGATLQLPCYRFDGRRIWGLTLWIVDELLALRAAGPTG